MNVTKCQKCGYDLISEEVSTHECKDVIDYKIEPTIIWLFDGEIWYPRKRKYIGRTRKTTNHNSFNKIPKKYQPKGNRDGSTADVTEPKFSIVLYYAAGKNQYNGICLRCFTSSQARKRR